jgi:hypothetical protein
MFECAACHEGKTYTGKRPSFCAECSDARRKLSALARNSERYPQKHCRGCGCHMANFDYGSARFCSDCATVNERRHNGWIDPYSKPFDKYVAANDNSASTKVCACCECDLPLSDFHKSKSGAQGVLAECAECRAAIRAEQGRESEYKARKMTPARLKARRIRVSEKWNKKRVAENRMVGRQIDKYLAVWRKSDKARKADALRISRRADKIADKPWLAPGLAQYERRKIRAASDQEFAVRMRLEDQLRLRKRGKCGRADKAIRAAIRGAGGLPKFLGYTADELRVHLEKLFTSGMGWDAFRRGEIHLDHKKPLSHFDLTDDDQVKEAWSLGNLQPLWAADNIAKGARTDEEWRAAA